MPSALALESGVVAGLPLVNAVLDRLGLEGGEAAALDDDRAGRARDRLFDADRAALMAELVLRTLRELRSRPVVSAARATG